MESFWKGVFSPTIKKHVLFTVFVPLEEMNNDDWDVLDYEALRPSARLALDEAILDGTLDGFVRVDYDLHKAHTPHGGKPRYFFPHLKGAPVESEKFERQANFDNEVDQDAVPTEASDRVDQLRALLKLYVSYQMAKEIILRIERDTEYYDEFVNSVELLHERNLMLLLLIKLLGEKRQNPERLKEILAAIDNLDDEVYAALNDDEPLE